MVQQPNHGHEVPEPDGTSQVEPVESVPDLLLDAYRRGKITARMKDEEMLHIFERHYVNYT